MLLLPQFTGEQLWHRQIQAERATAQEGERLGFNLPFRLPAGFTQLSEP